MKVTRLYSTILYLLQITTNRNISSELYCGTEVPKILTFDATFVVLTFESDDAVTRRGFEITYKVLSRKGYQFCSVQKQL